MKTILGFDTCNGVCSVALQKSGEITSFIKEDRVSMQSAMIISMIETALKENHMNYQDLDSIAVNVGPGSFTGVRVGIAVAKSLKLVTKLPIIGVSGLLSVALTVKNQEKNILSVMDARRGQVYAQLFDSSYQELSSTSLIACDQLEVDSNVMLVGEGGEYLSPDAKMVIGAANHMLAINEDYDSCSPLYIREVDAKIA